ncbi:MAG: hypothetical protein ACTSVZ_06170, partial [Promethearchaeota archaeon]
SNFRHLNGDREMDISEHESKSQIIFDLDMVTICAKQLRRNQLILYCSSFRGESKICQVVVLIIPSFSN